MEQYEVSLILTCGMTIARLSTPRDKPEKFNITRNKRLSIFVKDDDQL